MRHFSVSFLLTVTILSAQVIQSQYDQAKKIYQVMQKDLLAYDKAVAKYRENNESTASHSKRKKLINKLNHNATKLQAITAQSAHDSIAKNYNINIFTLFHCQQKDNDAACFDKAVIEASHQAQEDLRFNLVSYFQNNFELKDLNITTKRTSLEIKDVALEHDPKAWKLHINFKFTPTIHDNLMLKIKKPSFLFDDNISVKGYQTKTQPTLLAPNLVAAFSFEKTLGTDLFPKPMIVNSEALICPPQTNDDLPMTKITKDNKLSVIKNGSEDKSVLSKIILLEAKNKKLTSRLKEAQKVSALTQSQLNEAKVRLTQLEKGLNNARKTHGFYFDATANYSYLFDEDQSYAGPKARVGYTIGDHSFGFGYEALNLLDEGSGVYDEFTLFTFDYMIRSQSFFTNINIGAGNRRIQDKISLFQEFDVPLYAAIDLFYRFGEFGFYFDMGLGVQYLQTDHQQAENSYYISALNYTVNDESLAARLFIRIGLQ